MRGRLWAYGSKKSKPFREATRKLMESNGGIDATQASHQGGSGGGNINVTHRFRSIHFHESIESGTDPFLAHHKGDYYLTTTQGNACASGSPPPWAV